MLYFVSSLYKSGVLWAKRPLCVNKFTQLVPLVLSVLPTMSIGNHIIGGAAGGAVVNTLDSGSRGRGFEPHSSRRVVSFSKTYLPPPTPKVPVIPRQRWPRPNMTEKLFTVALSIKKLTQRIWKYPYALALVASYCCKNPHCVPVKRLLG